MRRCKRKRNDHHDKGNAFELSGKMLTEKASS